MARATGMSPRPGEDSSGGGLLWWWGGRRTRIVELRHDGICDILGASMEVEVNGCRNANVDMYVLQLLKSSGLYIGRLPFLYWGLRSAEFN